MLLFVYFALVCPFVLESVPDVSLSDRLGNDGGVRLPLGFSAYFCPLLALFAYVGGGDMASARWHINDLPSASVSPNRLLVLLLMCTAMNALGYPTLPAPCRSNLRSKAVGDARLFGDTERRASGGENRDIFLSENGGDHFACGACRSSRGTM